jgi:hypothetical protein
VIILNRQLLNHPDLVVLVCSLNFQLEFSKNIYLLLTSLFFFNLAYSQFANITYNARVDRIEPEESGCWEAGSEEYTGKGGLSDDANTTVVYSSCQQCNNNGNCTYGQNAFITTRTNTSASRIDPNVDGWEDDAGNRCDHNSGDDCRTGPGDRGDIFIRTVGSPSSNVSYSINAIGGYGDGGLVTTNNDELAYILRIKRVHGGEQKYYHKVIGGNFRIDALQAAVLRVKLPHLDSWSEKRRHNANRYTQLFVEAGLAEETGKTSFDAKNKVLLPKAVYEKSGTKNYHIYNQYIVRVDKRDEMREFLTKNEIGTEIYYPVPFHLQECFKDLGHKKGDFPISEFSADKSIAIPIYPELSDEQLIYVVETFKKFFNQ